MRRPRQLALALLLAALAGCSGLLQSNAKPEQTYYLRAPAVPAGATPPGNAAPQPSLRIAHPLADPGLESSHIMLLQSDHRMSFYTGARWPAPMPDLVGALAVQTLGASGDWSSVGDPASPFPADYLLQITLRRFDADYGDAPGGATAPAVHVVFDCSIGRRDGREVIGSFVVAGSATAAANRLSEVVAAFEQATDTALQQLAQQVRAAARADAERSIQNGAAPAPSSNRHSQ